ncbi:hypothetical protein LH612_31670, partial [Klebsiella pneumoniae]|nr:hypothetical protein [Klebsiella pneumoniae]
MTAGQREGESGMPADSPEPPPSSSRAGRDLPAAIGVGLVLGAAVVLSLLMVRYLFIGIVAAAVAVATVELAGALRRGAGIRVSLFPVLAGGQAMVWLSWPFGLRGVLLAFVVTVLGCMVWRFPGGGGGEPRG